MDNEKDIQNTLNNENQNGIAPINPQNIFNSNDSIEVNNLINLTNADITSDILEQLEARAREEQKKLDQVENDSNNEKIKEQQDIHIPEGLPAEDGAVNITSDILERPINSDENKKTFNPNELIIDDKKEEKLDPLEEAKLNAVYKKYVIYINNENEHFIDSLTLDERKKLINKILYEQNIVSEQERMEKKKRENAIKLFLSVVTFLIAVPVVYLIFNVSMEATIQNYRHSKSNFEVLYKETGKIKLNSD